MHELALGSYAPLYIEPRRRLLELPPRQSRPATFVLLELASHANELGLCFPGLKRLATMTQYSVKTVKDCLTLLSQFNYLRVVEEQTLTGNRKYYQLSPDVLHIAPDHRAQAQRLFEGGKTYEDINSSNITLTKESQPAEPEPEPEPEPALNQNKNQHQQIEMRQPQTPHPDEITGEKTEKQIEREFDPPERSSESKPNEVRPMNKIDIQLVKFITNWGGGTTERQAMHIVSRYGSETVRRTIDEIDKQIGVRNPQGLLICKLRIKDNAHKDAQPLTGWEQYAS